MPSDSDRSDQLGMMQIEASNKLDYFILGATLAICAYLAQTNPYAQIGANKETYLLISLLVFAVSAACGFWRIEAKIAIMNANAHALGAETEAEHDAHRFTGAKYGRKSIRYYTLRNYLLVVGLLCYLATKVWATYQHNGWVMNP